jgi:ketosteroid isomerase-like protein
VIATNVVGPTVMGTATTRSKADASVGLTGTHGTPSRDTPRMSSANLDLVRSIYTTIGRGDYSSAEWADPKIEYVVADGPEPGSVTGSDGLVQAMRNLFSSFVDFRVEPEHVRELDAERVLVLTKASGRGKRSGLQVGDKTAELFEIHDGKVTRIVAYFDRDRALDDLGLKPDTST